MSKQIMFQKQVILLFLQDILTVPKFGVPFYSIFATKTNLFTITEAFYFLSVFKNKGLEGIEII